MKTANTFPPRREAEARIDDARQLLFEDVEEHKRRHDLSDAEVTEVLADLWGWYSDQPVRAMPRRKAVRR